MKNRRSKFLGAAAALLVLAQPALWTRAAEPNTFLREYGTAPGQLILYGSDLGQPVADQFEVHLSGQELPILSAATAGQGDLPITVYCLVDISGSMKDDQIEQAKQTLHALAQALGEGDQMVVATLGNTVSRSDFLTTSSQMVQAIDALTPISTEDTNLYAGMVESIDVLTSDTRVGPCSCLVILSDGEDDQTSGITQSEAEDKVQTSGIPVYTIATLRANPSQSQQDYAKLLGSFARMSPGGVHFTPQLDGSTPEQIGQDIISRLENSLVLTVDSSAAVPDKDTLLLRISYTAESAQYTDTLTVYAQDLQPAPAAETGESEDSEPAPESDVPPVLIIGAVLVVSIGAAAALLLAKKRRDSKAAAEAQAAAEAKAAEEARLAEEKRLEEEARAAREAAAAVPELDVTYRICLDAIGYPNIQHQFVLRDGQEETVGRTAKASILLDVDDRRLSGCHCSLVCTGGTLTVKDLDSTNGTFVNGIPIRQLGPTLVPSGATIRMGSYEYRVDIQPGPGAPQRSGPNQV